MLFDKIQPDFTTELETQEEIRLSRIKNTTERGGDPLPNRNITKRRSSTPQKKNYF